MQELKFNIKIYLINPTGPDSHCASVTHKIFKVPIECVSVSGALLCVCVGGGAECLCVRACVCVCVLSS